MVKRYRVALQGFSEFERNALAFCLKHAGARVPAYEQAERVADSDFIVADANHPPEPGSLLRGGRLRDTLFVGSEAPRGAIAHLPRPLDPERILRALDRIVIQRLAGQRAPARTEPPAPAPQPILVAPPSAKTVPAELGEPELEIHFTDLGALESAQPAAAPEPAPETALVADALAPPPAPPRPRPPPAPPLLSEADRRAAKEAARRKSRAARLAQARRDGVGAQDTLLLDTSDDAASLVTLLEAFGFRVLRASSIAAAISTLESKPVAAAFLDMAAPEDDELDALALCQLIKRGRLMLPGDPPPVLMLSSERAASEGVRARLAGCDAFLMHPVSRGDVARALEACNVAFPADARRIPR